MAENTLLRRGGGVVFATFLSISTLIQADSSLELPENTSSLTVEQQILLLDIDIMLLKAELARKNGQAQQVQNYLFALEDHQSLLTTSSHNLSRYLVLKQYIEMVLEDNEDFDNQLPFQFEPTTSVALLPLTGPYASAGESVLAGLLAADGVDDIQVFDSHLYDSMFELWELVKLYEPTLIFGPLEPDNVAEFHKLNVQVPTIAFNQLQENKPHPYFKPLSPNSKDSIAFLVQSMIFNEYRSVGLLYDNSKASLRLKAAFEKAWAQQKSKLHADAKKMEFIQSVQIESVSVRKNVDTAVSSLLKINASFSRQNWLTKTIEHRLVSEARSRKDFDIVISFLPEDSASQVTPLLSYYELNQIIHIWLPSHLPLAEKFVANIPFWQPSIAILPDYYVQKLQQLKPSLNTSFNQKISIDPTRNNNVGIFYALGNLSVEAAKKMASNDDTEFQTLLGKMRVQKQAFHLYPSAYWLDEGALQKIK